MRVRTLLGDYPETAALKQGKIASDRLTLNFAGYSPPHTGFKAMVREQAFDISEMAIVTYLIAKSHNKPMVLLPAVVMGRFQHDHAIYNADRGVLTPADLKGKRVGIRSFTTTTGAWIRGILSNDYGVDLASIEWVTFEEPHVIEYRDTRVGCRDG
jgi:4,5-dihydroxyphthalate decarboxylase